MSQNSSSNRLWMEREWAGVSLGDQRRDARLISTSTAMADRPTATNPQRFDRNELRGFYSLVHSQRAQLDILQEGHRQRTRDRMVATPNRVLIIHDTTELDFTDPPAVRADLGPIGTGEGVGLLQHNSIAFDPQGKQVLGLLYQQLYKRQERPPQETRAQRALRPNKESQLWLVGIRGVGRPPAEHRWIDVCDRGGDFYEAMQQSRQSDHEFLIRIVQNRRVRVTDGETEDLQSLHATMATITATTTKEVQVASKGGRPPRTVTLQVGYRRVRLQPPQPDGFRRGLLPHELLEELRSWSSMAVTLIRVWEPEVIAARAAAELARHQVRLCAKAVKAAKQELARATDREKIAAAKELWETRSAEVAEVRAVLKEKNRQVSTYLDWWLATSSPIDSDSDALQAVSDYEWRWPVAEEYHKVEKSGLKIESQRFETIEALKASLAILAVVAIRLLQLRYARDEQPDADANVLATPEEIAMVGKATGQVGSTMTVRAFVDAVAKLGGYLGRKGDGPPGWQSLWRGYQRLSDLLLGQALFRDSQDETTTRARDKDNPKTPHPD